MKKIIYAVMLLLGMSIKSSCEKDDARSIFSPGSRWAMCYFGDITSDEYGDAFGMYEFKKGGQVNYYMLFDDDMDLEFHISKDGHWNVLPSKLTFAYSSTFSSTENTLTINGATVNICILSNNIIRIGSVEAGSYLIRVAENTMDKEDNEISGSLTGTWQL